MKKRKENKYMKKRRELGLAAIPLMFFFYSSWNISWITKMGILGNFYLLITFVSQRAEAQLSLYNNNKKIIKDYNILFL